MTNARTFVFKIAHSDRVKSFRTRSAFIFIAITLLVAAAAAVATAQTYTVLYNFDGRHGARPGGLFTQGRDGSLYGTAWNGGTNADGVVFKITSSGKLSLLHKFDGTDGFLPYGGLTLGTDGYFYGITYSDLTDFQGTIFKITKGGSLTTLHNFTGGPDGGSPYGPPIQGNDDNFYGTAGGRAYKITPSGSFTVIGSVPSDSWASLILGTDGNFYGTTLFGGSSDWGTVFRMTPKGPVKILYAFDGTHGMNPYAAVNQGSDGDLYGTTDEGGTFGKGVVFKLTPQGAITVLHNFGDPNYPHDGQLPMTGLVQATDGNFYGVTTAGGTGRRGVIFKTTATGDYSILYNFDGASGAYPRCPPMQHTDGRIYGLTVKGGSGNRGVVYSLDLGLAPFVSLVSTSGKVGKTIEILGQGFTGTTAVSFNGTAATFTVVSDTYMKTTVPTGATSGLVTVTTPAGTLTSNKQFTVKP